MNRREQLRAGLARAQEAGALKSWESYAPGDRKGRRWVLEPERARDATSLGGTLTLTTAEAEVWLLGLGAGLAATAGRSSSEPELPLDALELRQEAQRIIGEDRVPLGALRELLADYSDVDYEQAEVEAAERRAWGGGGP